MVVKETKNRIRWTPLYAEQYVTQAPHLLNLNLTEAYSMAAMAEEGEGEGAGAGGARGFDVPASTSSSTLLSSVSSFTSNSQATAHAAYNPEEEESSGEEEEDMGCLSWIHHKAGRNSAGSRAVSSGQGRKKGNGRKGCGALCVEARVDPWLMCVWVCVRSFCVCAHVACVHV
jgi:hypothetical protein